MAQGREQDQHMGGKFQTRSFFFDAVNQVNKHLHERGQDVIKTHFTLRARKIEAHIRAWAEQEPVMRAYVDGGHISSTLGMPGPINLLNVSTGGEQKVDKPLDVLVTMGWNSKSSSQVSAKSSRGTEGSDLLDEFLKGVERVSRWEEGSYTSP
jgi:hypothetical protein